LKERLDRGTKTVKYTFLWKINYYSILVVGCRFEGKKAVVELGKVLGDNPDISVLNRRGILMMIVSVHQVL
jgi:hypothetical protein